MLMAFQEVTAIEQSVRELQDRIGDLMTIIVGRVTPSLENIDTTRCIKAVEDIQEDIEDVKRQVVILLIKDQYQYAITRDIGHLKTLSPKSTKLRARTGSVIFSSKIPINRGSIAA
jgi:hypothetical protein